MSVIAHQQQQTQANWSKLVLLTLFGLFVLLCMIEPAFAGGTGTGTGTAAGGAGAAQARITNVAVGWQNIVQGIGVAVLVIAWSVIGYMIAFGGKTFKDMTNPLVGSTIAGLAPILVGWLFS
jgi:hypothetical protein